MSTRRPHFTPLWSPDAEAARREHVVERIVAQRRRRGLDGEHVDPAAVAAEVAEQSRDRTVYAGRRGKGEVVLNPDGSIRDAKLVDIDDDGTLHYLPTLVGATVIGGAGDALSTPQYVRAFNAQIAKGSHTSYQAVVGPNGVVTPYTGSDVSQQRVLNPDFALTVLGGQWVGDAADVLGRRLVVIAMLRYPDPAGARREIDRVLAEADDGKLAGLPADDAETDRVRRAGKHALKLLDDCDADLRGQIGGMLVSTVPERLRRSDCKDDLLGHLVTEPPRIDAGRERSKLVSYLVDAAWHRASGWVKRRKTPSALKVLCPECGKPLAMSRAQGVHVTCEACGYRIRERGTGKLDLGQIDPDDDDGQAADAALDAATWRCGLGREPSPSDVAQYHELLARFGDREAVVARMVQAGYENAEIAAALGLSTRTAKRLRAAVRAKLDDAR